MFSYTFLNKCVYMSTVKIAPYNQVYRIRYFQRDANDAMLLRKVSQCSRPFAMGSTSSDESGIVSAWNGVN